MSTKRILKELADIQRDPPDGVAAGPENESDIKIWRARILGLKDSPYEGGEFYLKVQFHDDYPFSPPTIHFITKMYHPNINERGGMCLGVLETLNWSPALTVANVLANIRLLLTEPNPDDSLAPDIARVYKTDRKKYEETVREYTMKYAM
jgi:ubiquitin-conjugating enzyme E2 D/E